MPLPILPLITSVPVAPKYLLVGDPLTILLNSQQTADGSSLFHNLISPGFGPPPHVHQNEDETFFLLDGELTFWVDGKPSIVQPGSVVYGPRDVPHHFKNTGTKIASMLIYGSAGGTFDAYVKTVGELLPQDYIHKISLPPTPEHIQKVLTEGPNFGIRFLL